MRDNAHEALSHLLHKCQQLLCPRPTFSTPQMQPLFHGTRMTEKPGCPSSVSQREGTMLPPKEPILLNKRHVD